MKWIKINHTSGTDLINVEQIYRIGISSTNNLLFYNNGSTSPITLSFSSSAERNDIFEKFKKILDSIDINQIAPQ